MNAFVQAPFYIEERLVEKHGVRLLLAVNPRNEDDKIVLATIQEELIARSGDLHREFVELLGRMLLVSMGRVDDGITSIKFGPNVTQAEIERACAAKLDAMNASVEQVRKAAGK